MSNSNSKNTSTRMLLLLKRLAAYFVDYILIMVVVSLVEIMISVILYFLGYKPTDTIILNKSSIYSLHTFYTLLLHSFYFAYFLSSKKQASLGQQLLVIHTISCSDHRRISFKLAFDRSISQFLLPIILLMMNYVFDNFFNSEQYTFHQLWSLLIIIAIILLNILMFSWYISAIFSSNNKTFHDRLFNTMVVTGKFTANLNP